MNDRAAIDMKTTVQANIELIPDLIVAHGIAGNDTVATYLECGKLIVSKVLQSRNHPVMMIREVIYVIHQATQFGLAC